MQRLVSAIAMPVKVSVANTGRTWGQKQSLGDRFIWDIFRNQKIIHWCVEAVARGRIVQYEVEYP